jgi:CYTH domain-containing protein
MTVVRRFLLASSLARLVSRERGSTFITEGYFAGQQGRSSYVAIGGERYHLVLVTEPTESALVEERTDIPPAHAEALLEVCAGRVTYERSAVPIDSGAEVLIDRMTHPGVLDTVSVELDNPDQAAAFVPPVWFGPEITSEPSFGRQVIAFNGVPAPDEIALSNAILEALLDLLEGRVHVAEPAAAPPPSPDHSVLDALRRLSASARSVPEGPTEPLEARGASPEPRMPDIDRVSTHRPSLESYRQPQANSGEVPDPETDETRRIGVEDSPSTGPDRPILSRLFPRLTH